MSRTAGSELAALAQGLRRARKSCGLSQFRLGERIGYEERSVRNAESGRIMPSAEFMAQWLAWYRGVAGDETTADRVAVLYARTQRLAEWWPPEWGTLDETGVSPAQDEDSALNRRTLLGGAVAATTAALLPSTTPDIAGYEQIARALRRAYERIPARLHLPRVRAEIETLEYEIQNVRGNDRLRLLRVYGELHLLAGWMARWDLGELSRADRHTRDAAIAAYAGQDRDLLAHCLSLHALILQKNAASLPAAVEAADNATRLVSPRRPATASYVHLAAAGVYSMVGRDRDTRGAIDAAQVALSHVTSRSVWRGTGLWSAARAAPFEGYALRRIGAAAHAKLRLGELFESGALEGDDARKYRVEAETDHAEVSMQLGAPEEAARWASAAYDDAVAAGYPSEIDRVGTVYSDLLRRVGPIAEVRELGSRLQV